MLSTGMLLDSLFEKEQLAQREAIQLKPYWGKKKTQTTGWAFCQTPTASQDN